MTPTEHAVTCAECKAPMRLRMARRGPGEGKPFYGCSRYPACKATHGAHPDGAPMGIPGDAATKAARIRAHNAFDRLWKGEGAVMSRGGAYGWLEEALGLERGKGHIGSFDVAACDRVVAVVGDSMMLLVERAALRAALARRFRVGGAEAERSRHGANKQATAAGRRWLATALGLEGDVFVRDLDVEQCAQALRALKALDQEEEAHG